MQPQVKLDPVTETALRSMRDLAVPQPVSWFPQTWGWVMLGILIALALAAWLVFALRRYRRNAYRREAIAMLDSLQTGMRNGAPPLETAYQLCELLKRTALAAYDRKTVAGLSSNAWVGFIEKHGHATDVHALRQLLEEVEYHPQGFTSMPEVTFVTARTWIEAHHVSA